MKNHNLNRFFMFFKIFSVELTEHAIFQDEIVLPVNKETHFLFVFFIKKSMFIQTSFISLRTSDMASIQEN